MSEDKLRLAREIVHDEPDEAIRLCNEVLNDHMDDVAAQRALFMAAYIMMEAERYGLSYNLYARCAELNPNVSAIWSNMGMCLEDYSPEKAIECFQRAYKLDPDNAHAYANEGLMWLQSGNPQACIDLSQKALSLDPDLRSAKHNKGLAQLMLRDFKAGWKNYFDTLGVKHREARDYGLPEWNGEPGTVIVYGEQGVGDEIMFATCLEDMSRTNDIIFDTDSRLEGLFGRTFDFPVYGTRFKTETPLLDEHEADYQCAIGQLPYFYRNRDEDFPGTPYLKPDPERQLQWKALFDTFKGKKIGVAWRGGIQRTGEHKRSLELSDLEPLLNDHDTFISLEYKAVDQNELDRYGIKSYPRATGKGGDIDDLAALVSQLDYVICPCTTVVYIAGGLGVPCDVLVPEHPGYRYHTEGIDFPWFDCVSLRRQKGTWRELVEKIADFQEIYACLQSA